MMQRFGANYFFMSIERSVAVHPDSGYCYPTEPHSTSNLIFNGNKKLTGREMSNSTTLKWKMMPTMKQEEEATYLSTNREEDIWTRVYQHYYHHMGT